MLEIFSLERLALITFCFKDCFFSFNREDNRFGKNSLYIPQIEDRCGKATRKEFLSEVRSTVLLWDVFSCVYATVLFDSSRNASSGLKRLYSYLTVVRKKSPKDRSGKEARKYRRWLRSRLDVAAACTQAPAICQSDWHRSYGAHLVTRFMAHLAIAL